LADPTSGASRSFRRAALLAALLLLGGALLALLFLPFQRGDKGSAIVATAEIQAALEEERAELLGRALTEAERQRLASDWVDQEVLVREAYRRGLDRDDPVVRHRLIEKMRLLLREKPREPSAAELLGFYRDHPDRYQAPARLSVEHVFFFKGGAAARELAVRLQELRRGADFRKMGDPFWLGPVLQGVTQAELARVLGDAFAQTVFALEPGTFSGPHESIRGLHLVRVAAREPSRQAPFEAVESTVREDWHEANERDTLARQIAELKKGYRIQASPSPR
jgi:parvulin-like peptidyl-prolyl isomerase